MLTLYDAPRCPFCARARIVLAEKDIPYETVVIDLANRPAWLYEKNPSGKVPVLEDDAWVLPESAVIAEYLEERFPEPALLPADPAERAIARLLVFRFDDLGDAYYALRRGDEGAGEAFAGELAHVDALLSHMPYLTGCEYGLADIDYVPWVIRARELLEVSFDPYPALSKWLERLSERPAITAELDIVAALRAMTGGDATAEELVRRLGEPGLLLLDVRSAEEYSGESGYPCDARQGHLPGARHLDVGELFQCGSAEEVRELVGLAEGAEIVAYCHSGSRSAMAVSILVSAGYEARNYPGSWHEWSADSSLPAEADPSV